MIPINPNLASSSPSLEPSSIHHPGCYEGLRGTDIRHLALDLALDLDLEVQQYRRRMVWPV
jgi:hypothetical protein